MSEKRLIDWDLIYRLIHTDMCDECADYGPECVSNDCKIWQGLEKDDPIIVKLWEENKRLGRERAELLSAARIFLEAHRIGDIAMFELVSDRVNEVFQRIDNEDERSEEDDSYSNDS